MSNHINRSALNPYNHITHIHAQVLITTFVLRCRSLLASKRVDADLDDELRFHLEQHVEAQVSRGVTPEEARRRAVIAIGGLDQQKDACRDTRGVTLIDHTVR